VLATADFFDFSIYVDVWTDRIERWFLSRLRALREVGCRDQMPQP
jgi:pantothenate kinase